jgi:hypothetical protein
MFYNKDYIMNQIEAIVQFIVTLTTSKKAELVDKNAIDQRLARLTGIDISLFQGGKNARLLASMLALLDDDNKKALAAKLLELKDKKLYQEAYQSLIASIDLKILDPKIKELLQAEKSELSS